MIPFEEIWQTLYDHGASSKKEEGTRRYWEQLSPEQQERVFTTITSKLREGKFVQYDPIRAINEAVRSIKPLTPEFLRGDEGGYIVQVRYNGAFKLCRKETATAFGLTITKDPW